MSKKKFFSRKAVAAVLALVMCLGTGAPSYAAGASSVYETDGQQTYSIDSSSKSGGSTAETDNYVNAINTFNATFVSGADTVGSNLVWTPKNNSSGHSFKYRVDYSYSVVGSIPAETIVVKAPRTILTDKNGNQADSVIMSYPSKDELSIMSDQELADTDGFAYYDDGTNIVIYNFREMKGAIAGSFEIAYATTKTTQNYYDYGNTKAGSSPFNASVAASGLTASATAPAVYINTTAVLESTYKASPQKVYRAWQSSWGTAAKPSNDSDYYYLVWEIRSNIAKNDTQKYNLTMVDSPSSGNGSVSLIGYRFSGQSGYSTKNTVENVSGSGTRYDSVLVALKKSDFASLTSWTVNNSINVTLTPVDGVDSPTTAYASKSFSWTKPVYQHPRGHFMIWKYGNENWYDRFRVEWPYAFYSMDEMQEQTISSMDNIKYAIETTGYPFPWTVKDGTSGSWDSYVDDLNASKVSDPYAFGYKDVTYTLTDDTFYPMDSRGYGTSKSTGQLQSTDAFKSTTYTASSASDVSPLEPEDYDITSLYFSVSYTDVPRNNEGKIASTQDVADGKASKVGFDEDEQKYNVVWHNYDSTDVLTIYTKSGSADYVKAGTLDLSTMTLTKADGSLIDSVSKSGYITMTFKDGVDGVRIQDTNNYYNTSYMIYTYMSIKGSDPVLGWVRSGVYGSANKDTKAGTKEDPYEYQVLLKNVANMKVDDYSASYDSAGNLTNSSARILDLSKVIGDRLRTTERHSQIEKDVTGAINVARKKTYTISWRVNAFESYLSGTDSSNYLQQESGTFYDLLPAGAILQTDSVKVGIPRSTAHPTQTDTYKGDSLKYLSDTEYEVSTIENYKDSGRTMLIVKMNTPGLYYTMFYNTVHTWDSIADYGVDVLNPVAYETGNDKIYAGYPDNGGVGTDDNGNTTHALSHDPQTNNNEYYYTDLDPDTDANKFIYDEEPDEISAVIAASAGLNKRVKASDDTTWVYDTKTVSEGYYQYRLRLANTYLNSSENLIFYDSLENSNLVDGAEAAESDWHGTLQSIDMTQLKTVENTDYAGNGKGTYLNPVAYVSTVSNLDLDGATDTISGTKLDLTNSAIWTRYDTYYTEHSGDLSGVKAIAIDMRKDTAGNDFVLAKGKSLSAVLYMQAPEKATSQKENADYPWAYNSVYLHETIVDALGGKATSTINQNYTSIRLVVSADVSLHKVNVKNENENISGITFRIKGTSDYGTEIDETKATGRDGNLTFKKVEKGTYILQEYASTVDWVEDHTEHIVNIDENGNVTIDGEDYTDSAITITNEPRIHTDVSFEKISSLLTSHEVDLAQSRFKLYGTSDYGFEIVKYATAKEKTTASGEGLGTYYVEFDDLEKGSYDLVEIGCADTFIKNPCTYKVTVDADANVTIVNTTPKAGKISFGDVLHAHTANVDDSGTQSGDYNGDVSSSSTATASVDGKNVNENSQTVSIAGAEKLHVVVTYQSADASKDKLYVYKGSIARSDGADNGTGGELAYASALGGTTKDTVEFDVEGSSVTFVWSSDSGDNSYYGYYATVTAPDKEVADLYAVKLAVD